jgi:hypothetical protein
METCPLANKLKFVWAQIENPKRAQYLSGTLSCQKPEKRCTLFPARHHPFLRWLCWLAGVNVCCVRDTSSLDFMHAIDETVEGVGGLHPCLFFGQKMCSCARFFSPIRLLLA